MILTSTARRELTSILGQFREQGAQARPVVFGSHRKPEGVLLSYQSFERMLGLIEDLEIVAQIGKRERGEPEVVEGIDDLAQKYGIETPVREGQGPASR